MTSYIVPRLPDATPGNMQKLLDAWMLMAAGAALWLLNHPYGGIWHDARIYTLSALHWLNPAPFSEDPWFQDKAADGLTLFIHLYGMAIKLLGVSNGAIFIVLAGAGLWLGATYWLCTAWFERRAASFIFLALSAISLTYCLGQPMLVLSEAFATARLLAIPFSIAGLVATTQGRFWLGIFLQLLGMLFHPLISVWGLMTIVLSRLSDRIVFALVALGAALVVVLYLNPMDIPAFRIMDAEWQAMVRGTAVIVFDEMWPKLAINDALWWFSALLFGGLFGQAGIRRLYQVVGLVAALALLVSLVTSYFLPVVFLLQAQLWRALWLAVVVGFVAAMDIGWVAVRAGTIGKGLAALLALTFLFRDWGGGLVLFLFYIVWSTASDKMSRFLVLKPLATAKMTWAMVAVAVAACLPDILMDIWIIAGMERTSALGLLDDYGNKALAIASYTVVPFLFWVCLTQQGMHRHFRRSMFISLCLILLTTGMYWDRRSSTRQQIEARYRVGGNHEMFSGLITPGRQVYWQGNALRVWFDLGTASYVSSEQAIGIVFSRKRMAEVRHRLERVLLMEQLPQSDGDLHEMAIKYMSEHGISNSAPLDLHTYERNSLLTKSGVQALCLDPELDFVIDQMLVPGWPVSRYSEEIRGRNVDHYLYDCKKFGGRNAVDRKNVSKGSGETARSD